MAHIRSRKHSKPVHLLALLAASVPVAGLAQQTPTLPTVTVKEAPEVPFKADKSANDKFTAPLVDTPKTIQIIKKDVLEEQGAVTLMEALRNTPGITMQMGENGNTSAGDTFQLRGFSLQQNTFVDGIRDLGSVTRDTFNLEQVEIVKGAAGAETGRGAASGFLNLISKQAHLGDESSASGTIGTASRKRATVDLNKQLGETSAFRLNAMVQDSGVDGRDYVENTGQGLALSYVTGLNTPTRIHLYSQHVRQKNVPDGGIPSIGFEGFYNASAAIRGAAKVNRENYYGSVNDREKIEADMFTAKVEHDLGQGTTVRNVTRVGQNHNERVLTGINAITAVTADPATWTISRSRQRVDRENTIVANQTSMNTEFSAGGMQHSLAAGVELMRETYKDISFATTGLTITPANLYNPDPYQALPIPFASGAQNLRSVSTLGLYVFDTAKLNDRWSLNGGVRVDRYKLRTRTFDTAGALTDLDDSRSLVSWSFGGVYKPAENGSVYASYANSSTPPGTDAQLSTAAGNINNPALDPQKTQTVELGTKWELLNKRLNVAAAVFRTVNDNQTSYDYISNTTQQFGKTQVQGIELSAVGQITNFWQITAGLAKTSTKQIDQRSATTTTDSVRWSPDLTFTLWNSYQLDKWTLGLGARYTSEQKRVITAGTNLSTQNVPNIPSSWVADAMVAYQFSDKVSVRLNVYNLFDKEYLSVLNNGGSRLALGAPRSAALTANFKF
ncbi:catecholate siderophore receptor Fiu [Hydrogenophaga laconesensis]|uniref:Catecholate siderophore receptor n=1 Tax=Hydrogenophaga laconesensis TaxID=1805971 RepID=A0ABU1V9U4_9BURK|nr:catecholate siderophore receptor Fiu [Hydrogenophaga laconesensis]MDR7094212.1 catecholate siderophore receptor [Hydrogenophaga laconesensis]